MAEPEKNRFTTFVFPLAGIVSLTAGFTWLYRPLGPIVLGIIFITMAFLGRRP